MMWNDGGGRTRSVLSALVWLLLLIGQARAACVFNSDIVWNRTVLLSESPCVVTRDITLWQRATLQLEPGVEMRFAPRAGLDVKGTLIAEGTSDKRIVFTKNAVSPDPQWPTDIRLVDGYNVTHGRLQLFYKNKWRGVCVNYRKSIEATYPHSVDSHESHTHGFVTLESWSQETVDIACRQLGFRSGNFSFERIADNETHYMLYESPDCRGGETNIFDCPGYSAISIGKKVCVDQLTAGLICVGVDQQIENTHWRGLTFYNSTIQTIDARGDFVKRNVSASSLRYVDILYAGVNSSLNHSAALSASPYPPLMDNIRVKFSALDGLNFTESQGVIMLSNSEISNNRGFGLNISHYYDEIRMDNTQIDHNHGIGIRARLMDVQYFFYREEDTLCRRPMSSGPDTFPILMVAQPDLQNSCWRDIKTTPGNVITVDVLEARLYMPAEGSLEIIDDPTSGQPTRLLYFKLNGTLLPQSVTSTTKQIRILFNWVVPNRICPGLEACIKITIYVRTGKEAGRDITVMNSKIVNNTGMGLSLENTRSVVMVTNTEIAYNSYDTGLMVLFGASDVIVNNSLLHHQDERSAMNVTFSGGLVLLNNTKVYNNTGRGLTTHYLKMNKTRIERNNSIQISGSLFEYNEGVSAFFGNYCRSGEVLVNYTRFRENLGDAVEFESCYWDISTKPCQGDLSCYNQRSVNFTMTFNRFENNRRMVVRMSPALNVYGRLSNNTFTKNTYGTIFIDNTDRYVLEKEYRPLPVSYDIYGNDFIENTGWFVINIRLVQDSGYQVLRFNYNRLLRNNITQPFNRLNPRSRAAAVVILSSTNVIFTRNELDNPLSMYELATHLVQPSKVISIKMNFWNYLDQKTPNVKVIVSKMFDGDKRYDLARMDYIPTLSTNQLYLGVYDPQQINYEEPFIRGTTIGGELNQATIPDGGLRLTLDKGLYYVDRDISVRTSFSLTLRPGTELRFSSGIGMLVKGELLAEGTPQDAITYTMDAINYTIVDNYTTIRLMDGPDMFEGRLEVLYKGEWATVCNKGFEITEAAVVCEQLGMSLHPDDWFPERNIPGAASQRIAMSEVTCSKYDASLFSCLYDREDDHSCTHELDVAIRCKPMSWAGIRFTVMASASRLSYGKLITAGLMDFETLRYAPAVQIDYNRHSIHHLDIEHCLAPGLLIMHNDPFLTSPIYSITSNDNLGPGILVRSPYLEVYNSQCSSSKGAGLLFDPSFTQTDSSLLRSLMTTELKEDIMDFINSGITVQGTTPHYVITTPGATDENKTVDIQIKTDNGFKLVIYLLDYNPDPNEEQVFIFAGMKGSIQPGARNWTIEDDTVDLPINGSQYMVIRFVIRKRLSGRFAAIVYARDRRQPDPVPKFTLRNSQFMKNRYGVQVIQYSNPSNEFGDLFTRYRQITFRLFQNSFSENLEYAMYIPSISKYHEAFMPTYAEMEGSARLSEITFQLFQCNFTRNQGGVRADHNHVEYSNNVWHWEMQGNTFQYNSGGVEVELPMVGRGYSWKDQDLTWFINKSPTEIKPIDPWADPRLLHLFWAYNHTFFMNQSTYSDNTNFIFSIGGYYANTSLVTSSFRNNKCVKGLMMISGMEKEMRIRDNTFTDNSCRYILEYNVQSHYEYAVPVTGQITRNSLKNNKRPADYISPLPGQPDNFALSVKGVQAVKVNRNLFANSLSYEMVAGLTVAWLGSSDHTMDVTENYWGTVDQTLIREKIFDFDNWNSYAVATFHPFLTQDSFDSPLTTDPLSVVQFDPNQPLGGRLSVNVNLKKRAIPYEVKSDWTVMPGYTLTIDAGVEFRLYPNVGILVLGQMLAIGTPSEPIRFLPYYNQGKSVVVVNRSKRSALNYDIYRNADKRLYGGKSDNEGFVQFFNVTSHRWELMCDYQFNWQVARAVCKDLNQPYDNVIIRFTKYYDYVIYGYDKESIKFFWRTSYYCDGDEASLNDCLHRINYQLESCMDKRDYTYLRCEQSKLLPGQAYWGNIRFASTEVEYKPLLPRSEMKYLEIYGAGILHDERVGAIQSTYVAPTLSFMTIQHCAHNGVEYVSPWFSFVVANSSFTQNIGYGVGVVVLNGEMSDEGGTLVPLRDNTIPHRTFGMVRMCDSAKEITVTSRILVYYKYSYTQSSCVKVFRSLYDKQVALRFLQLNLYRDNFSRNAVEIFDGDQFGNVSTQIGELFANSSEQEGTRTYKSSPLIYSLSVHVHASPAMETYGFIAEIVTLPLNLVAFPPREPQQYNIIGDIRHTDNQDSFIRYRGVGKNNPDIAIMRCLMRNNGIQVLNLTSPSMIDLFIQNNARLSIINNYIAYNNGGGISVYTYAKEFERSLYANITANLIDGNRLGTPIYLDGSQYQQIAMANNYIGHNDVEHRNIIAVFGIGVNMTNNTIFENTGSSILNVSSNKDVGIYQFYSYNYMYRNRAIGDFHTTVFSNSSRQKFQNNYFFNEENDLEMATTNRTRLPQRNNEIIEPRYDEFGNLLPTPEPPLDESRVEATYNWWGADPTDITGGTTNYFVAGRIRDMRQDRYLVQVLWDPFFPYNDTLLSGYCLPGWIQYGYRCFMFMGGALTSSEARAQCMHEEGKLADSKDAFAFLPNFIIQRQPDYDIQITRVWVDYTGIAGPNSPCMVVRNTWLETYDCNAILPFICEQEPIPHVGVPWVPIIIALVCIGFALIVITALVICWKVKNRRREQVRMERKMSVRSSIRGSRASLGSMSVNSTRATSRPGRSVISIGGTTTDFTSTDTINKKGMPGSTDTTPTQSMHDITDSRHTAISDRDIFAPRLENEIAKITSKPMYDTVFENPGYDDSVERRRPEPYIDLPSESTSRNSSSFKPPDRSSTGTLSSIPSTNSSYSTVRKVNLDSRPDTKPSSFFNGIPAHDPIVRHPEPRPDPTVQAYDSSPGAGRKYPRSEPKYEPRQDPVPRPMPLTQSRAKASPDPPESRAKYSPLLDPRGPSPDPEPKSRPVPRPIRREEPRDDFFSIPESDSTYRLDSSPGARRRAQRSLGASRESLPPKETDF